MDHPLTDKEYLITSVTIEDVKEQLGKKIARRLDDNDMVYLADKMADAYLDCCFWTALRALIEEVILPRKEDT